MRGGKQEKETKSHLKYHEKLINTIKNYWRWSILSFQTSWSDFMMVLVNKILDLLENRKSHESVSCFGYMSIHLLWFICSCHTFSSSTHETWTLIGRINAMTTKKLNNFLTHSTTLTHQTRSCEPGFKSLNAVKGDKMSRKLWIQSFKAEMWLKRESFSSSLTLTYLDFTFTFFLSFLCNFFFWWVAPAINIRKLVDYLLTGVNLVIYCLKLVTQFRVKRTVDPKVLNMKCPCWLQCY